MKYFVVHTILLMSLFLVSCASQPADAQAPDEPVFSVKVKNSDDQVSVGYEENVTIIEIESPVGIGSAAFKLEAGDVPERIVLRLHVMGLEEFRLMAGEVVISATVSSSGGLKAQSQRTISGNTEQAIRSFDALWLDIQIVAESQIIPLEDGYFEIIFPMEFIQQSGGIFEIQWIDFYR